MHGDPGIMPVLGWIPVDPSCFLGARIVILAHFGVWDCEPGWVPGHRMLWATALALLPLTTAWTLVLLLAPPGMDVQQGA